MRETNKLISDKNVEALKRASDAMTAFGASLKASFATATAEGWTTVEAIMFLRAEAEKDRQLREKAILSLAGADPDNLPDSVKGPRFPSRQAQVEGVRRQNDISEEEVAARMEELKVEAIQDQIRARREELAVAREAEAEAAAAADRERERAALQEQIAETEANIAEYQEQLAYERLSIEEKLASQLERRAALEETLQDSALTEEERNEKLKEHEQTLKRILELELRIASAKGDGSGADPEPDAETGGTRRDPVADFTRQLQEMQDPAFVVLNGMDAMFESINQQVQELIDGTITWEQALRNVGGAILSSVITTFAQMAAAAIAGYAMTQLGIKSIQATAAAETVAMGSAASASWIPAAIAASIATMGTASAVGAASFAAAMLSAAAAALAMTATWCASPTASLSCGPRPWTGSASISWPASTRSANPPRRPESSAVRRRRWPPPVVPAARAGI